MSYNAGIQQAAKQQAVISSRQIERFEILAMGQAELSAFLNEEQLSNPLLELVDEVNDISEEASPGRSASGDGEDSRVLDIPEQKVQSLEEYLISQVPFKQYSHETAVRIIALIRQLDERTGYFCESREELLAGLGCTDAQFDEALQAIRSLEPAGVGAWDLEDSLLLQAKRKQWDDPVLESLITGHMKELAKGNFTALAKKMNVTPQKLKKAVERLRELNPKPAQGFGGSSTAYVVPDLKAEYIGGEWVITVQKTAAFRMNESYLKLRRRSDDPEVAKYLDEKIDRAQEIFLAIKQREEMLKNMLLFVLDIQHDFALGQGPRKKLTQKSVAEALGVHPSTINRAAKDKYVQVPAGVFLLKAFFMSGSSDEDADTFALPTQSSEPSTGEAAVSEICLVAPTEQLVQQNTRVCALYNKKVPAYLAALEKAPELVHRLHAEGAQVFISRKGTKKIIEAQGVPVVEIGLSLSDYIPLLETASHTKGIVAFFSYGIIPDDVRSMCYLLHIDARFYSFYKVEQCLKIVQEALNDGAVLGIGGADTAKAAEKLGLRHLIVENSPQSLLIAIEAAEQLLKLKKEEERKQQELKIRLERYETIFNFTHDAILSVDKTGTVEVVNKRAAEILKSDKKPCIGQPVQKVLPGNDLSDVLHRGTTELNRLMNLNGTMVSTNRVPVVVDDHVQGAVVTFQDIKTIQKSERKIRETLHDKGLTAKYHFSDIIGQSRGMQDVIRMAQKFAAANATILIYGESGTGKELMAQSIHNASQRADGPFVAVNCGSLPKDLLEAELFGYVEGAFTGASKGGRMGLFEMAHGGTIFLDEIGEMPLETQVQLLRVLQEKEIRRLGSDRITPVDIRVITATNRYLPEEIRKGHFREDLYYRLNVLNLELPPLRERREDIVDIGLSIYRGLSHCGPAEEQAFRTILEQFRGYDWPGNVRELRNLVERIHVLRSQGEDAAFVSRYVRKYLHLDAAKQSEAVPNLQEVRTPVQPEPENLSGNLAEWERGRIIQALQRNFLDINATAQELGISRTSLWRRMKKYDIHI